MQGTSIKKNFIYNIILTMSTYIFGLMVFPYVSRVLGIDMIGRVNFAEQTINYLRILAAMGISTVGVREIAACGNDRKRRSQVFSDIFSFVLILAFVALFILIILMITVPKFTEIRNLMFVGSFYLFFSSTMIEWFYQGIENFRFVTIRSVVVKIVYVLLVFALVQSPEDYLTYYILITASIVANALINICHSRKFATICIWKANPRKYARSIISLGIYMIMLSFFTTFNVVYLGMIKGEHEVGVYTTAIKIYTLILGVLTAYTTVMMPRMTSLLSENKVDEFKAKIEGSFNLVFCIAFPLVIGGVVFAPQIIEILAGRQYIEAIPVMQLVMPLILVVGLAQIWVIQILLPMKKDKVILGSAIISAAVGIIINIVLVGRFSYFGSAIAIFCAEITNDAITLVYALKKKYLDFPVKRMFIYLVLAFPYLGICITCSELLDNLFVSFAMAFTLCFGWFIIVVKKTVKTKSLNKREK